MPNHQEIETFLAFYHASVRDLTHAARQLVARGLPEAIETLDESAKLIGYSYGPG